MKRGTIRKGFTCLALSTLFSTSLISITNYHVDAAENKTPNNISANSDTTNKTQNPSNVQANYDENITTLSLKVLPDAGDNKRESKLTYIPSATSTDPYDGGELVGSCHIPLEGDVINKFGADNIGNHIRNFETGNYGARLNITFPTGVDAKAMYKAVEWEKSNESLASDFFILIGGVPVYSDLTWGLTWDQSSVLFDANKPNEFSIVARGINKDEVSTEKWNSYKPWLTETALRAVGIVDWGNIKGWAKGGLYFDLDKYTGNSDDTSKDKALTSKHLMPAKDRTLEADISVLDRESLVSGAAGEGNISKAEIKEGHEYDHQQETNSVDTWSDYLSVWDNEWTYNTNETEEPEIPGINSALPGKSILNRDLVTNPGDDFNSFASNRFDRVINYFTKQDVTQGNIGDVDHIDITHTPTKVPVGQTVPVTYSGKVTYIDGTTRLLMHNVLNVTNSKEADYSLTADTYTVGDDTLTGTYGADVKEVHLFVNGKDIGTATLNNGTYTFTGLSGKIQGNDKVTVAAMEGSVKKNEIPVTVKENNKPVINAADKTIKVGDTFDPKAGVTATDTEDGDLTSKIQVVSNTVDTSQVGKYPVTYSVTDSDGNTVEKTIIVTVKENNKPVINATDKTIKVGDTFDPKAGVTATDSEDGDLTSKIQVVSNTVDTSQAGKYIVIYRVTDSDGNTVEKTITVKVEENTNQGTIAPDIYDLSNNHRKITGSYTGDVAEVKVELNGELLPSIAALKDGKFEYYIGGHITSTKDQVFVIAYDKNNKELDRKQVKIIDEQTQGTVTPDSYDLSNNHRKITGSYTGDVAEVKVELNDQLLPGNGTLKDGKFEFYIGGQVKSTDDKVFVVAYDKDNKQLDKKQVSIVKS
ncbi:MULTISPECIES: immunoglobulin-like domain-containing protein [unclassified Enterococcus]|jgi:hypothetical protein|uniref:immunoglobulin-like domain-containing protein n=1 Tax=unclassified Enterococcus TaxID=2608891 RepID=UPI003D27BD24